jgi:hypothetical protein
VKVGAENRNKLIAAIALMGIAALLVLRMLFSSGPSPIPAAASSTAPRSVTTTRGAPRLRATGRKTGSSKAGVVPHSIDPTLRFDWLDISEKTKYAGTGRNIFMAQAEIPQPIRRVNTDAPKQPEPPPGPPPPPPINLKFYGFASQPGEPKKVFLSQGEDVFIAGEGEIVDRRYKVLHITPMSVEVEDVLNNNRQSIPLTQG